MSTIPGAPIPPTVPVARLAYARDGRDRARGKTAGGRVRNAGALLALLALVVGAAAPVQAQQTGVTAYGVEIIVFRVAGVPQGEDWAAEPFGRGFGNSAARGGGGVPQVLRILTPADYRLDALEATLKGSGAWRPVAHAAWVQTAASWGTHAGIALSDIGINAPGLTGMVYLERAPIYMHLGFDVHLTAGATYTIKEMRSIRYNDKQYFDHPGFGIIAVVTPIKHLDPAPSP